jgi:sulfhydrogenase subunit beta (sulfur reductase)
VFYKLSVESLKKILNELTKEYNVIVPVSEKDEIVLKEFNGKEFYTGAGLSINSLKELVLPQRDCMLKYNWEKESGYTVKEIKTENRQTIVFARPCDTEALTVTDSIFLNNRVDNYYKEKRDKLFIITLACTSMCKTCFCTEMGEGPFGKKGSDITGIIKDGYFIFKSLTEKNPDILKKFSQKAEKKGEDDILKIEQSFQKSNLKKINIEQLKKKAEEKYEDSLWEELGEICLGCGICTYLCPTCHCFDIQEEVKKNAGMRVRNWDTCQFALFTKEASGHNPRSTEKDRMRQRFLHKLQYIPENNNVSGCIGCGRCVKYCPVNIDIREVIKRIME